MSKLVSVVVPVYCAEQYLARCLESVRALRYDQLEIILVDDGSDDGSWEICRQYQKRDERIQCWHQENRGVSAARNYGMQKVNGEYLIFVDADDTVSPNLLENLISRMEAERADLLSFGMEEVPKRSLQEAPPVPPLCGIYEFSSKEKCRQFILEHYLNCEMQYGVWNKIFCTDIIKKNNLQFDTDVKIGEDLAFGMKYLLCCQKIACVDEVYYQYWNHRDSAINQMKDKICMNDFCNLLYGIHAVWQQRGYAETDFITVYIKTLDNQLRKRKQRAELRDSLQDITRKRFFAQKTVQVVTHVWCLSEAFGRKKYAFSRWLDCIYCLLHLLG